MAKKKVISVDRNGLTTSSTSKYTYQATSRNMKILDSIAKVESKNAVTKSKNLGERWTYSEKDPEPHSQSAQAARSQLNYLFNRKINTKFKSPKSTHIK